jgi:hypothetical protein
MAVLKSILNGRSGALSKRISAVNVLAGSAHAHRFPTGDLVHFASDIDQLVHSVPRRTRKLAGAV